MSLLRKGEKLHNVEKNAEEGRRIAASRTIMVFADLRGQQHGKRSRDGSQHWLVLIEWRLE